MSNELRDLRIQITNNFTTSELKTLIFDLGLIWDELAGGTNSEKIISLILHQSRNNSLSELRQAIDEKISPMPFYKPIPTTESNNFRRSARNFSLPHPRMNMDKEIDCIQQILTNQDTKTRLITLSGPSGSGKSWLIEQYIKFCNQHNHKVLPIDLKSEASISVEGCLHAIVSEIGPHFIRYNQLLLAGRPERPTRSKEEEWQNNLTSAFIQDLFHQPNLPKLFVLFDHFESKRADISFLNWLKNVLLPGLFSQQTVKIIVAGQDDLKYNRHPQYHLHFPLSGVPVECFYQFAEACNFPLDRRSLKVIHKAVNGSPKAIVDYVHSEMLKGASI